jgi:hypothetical protein
MAEVKSVVAGREVSTFNSPLNRSRIAYYDLFETFKDITDYTRKVEQELVAKNEQWEARTDFVDNGGVYDPRESFQGSDDKALLSNPTDINTYLYQDVLDRELQNLSAITQNLKLGSSAKKSKLEFTEQPTGIFNFGMASKGLYRKREYFCSILNLVVDENRVTRNKDGLFWYKMDDGKYAGCELRQEGTTEMLIKNPNAKILTSADGMIYTDPIRFEDVLLKFATSTKKVYLKKSEIKNLTGGGDEKYVDVYVTPMANGGIDKENLIYSSLPSILLAQTLEKAGFKVRINKIIINKPNDNVFVYSYVIKDYGEPINYQRVAIDASDPRVFRFEDFRRMGALAKAMLNIDLGSGYGQSPDGNTSDIIMNDYKHWLNKEIKRGSGKKIFNKNLNLHLMGTIDKSNDSHDIQMERVTAKFKEMLDKVAIEFSGSEQAIKDALERDMGTIPKAQIIRNFEESLRKTEPLKPADRDLQLPDNEFQQKLINYQNNLTKFNQIKTTL